MSSLPQNLQRTVHCASQGMLTLTDLGASGAIVMLAERDQMLTINPSAAFVLQQVLDATSELDATFAQALSTRLADRFSIPAAQAHADIERFFEQLSPWL